MRPALLFISPTIPKPTGGGTAMRAWNVLQAFNTLYDVRLLAGSRFFPVSGRELADPAIPAGRRGMIPLNPLRDPALLLSRTVERFLPSLFRSASSEPTDWLPMTARVRRMLDRFVAGDAIEVVHVFRLYMTPAIEAIRPRFPHARYQLDLDDIESETRLRMSERRRASGDMRWADRLERESCWCRAVEDTVARRFDRVWVCSRTDYEKLAARIGRDRIRIVPNTAVLPEAPPAYPSGPFTFLFVGSLDYLPNREAVQWLCLDIIPALRRRANGPFAVRIVGHVRQREMARLRAEAPEADVRGFAPNIEEHYARAHAVVAPLRGGGGTRIKILEAFAYGRPVVATPAAVEGLEVEDEAHALLGEDADTLADRCARLMADPALGAELSRRARDLLDRCHSPARMRRAVIESTARE